MGAGAAAFVGGLQKQAAFGHGVWRGIAGDTAVEGSQEAIDIAGGTNGLLCVAGEVVVGTFREPLGALVAGHRQQGIEIDHDRRRDLALVLALASQGHRGARGHLQPEPHHRLIDTADLLNVERPI